MGEIHAGRATPRTGSGASRGGAGGRPGRRRHRARRGGRRTRRGRGGARGENHRRRPRGARRRSRRPRRPRRCRPRRRGSPSGRRGGRGSAASASDAGRFPATRGIAGKAEEGRRDPLLAPPGEPSPQEARQADVFRRRRRCLMMGAVEANFSAVFKKSKTRDWLVCSSAPSSNQRPAPPVRDDCAAPARSVSCGYPSPRAPLPPPPMQRFGFLRRQGSGAGDAASGDAAPGDAAPGGGSPSTRSASRSDARGAAHHHRADHDRDGEGTGGGSSDGGNSDDSRATTVIVKHGSRGSYGGGASGGLRRLGRLPRPVGGERPPREEDRGATAGTPRAGEEDPAAAAVLLRRRSGRSSAWTRGRTSTRPFTRSPVCAREDPSSSRSRVAWLFASVAASRARRAAGASRSSSYSS